MPLFRTQSAAKQSSLAPHDSKARLRDVTTRRRSMAKPCTLHLHCAACAALQASDRQCRGSRGPPLAFSWGFKGAILSRERMAPLLRTPARCGRTKDAAPSAAPPSAPAGCPKPRSRAYVASAEPRSALKSGRNALHSHPSSQRRRTPSPSFTSKVKTTASSVCALTR